MSNTLLSADTARASQIAAHLVKVMRFSGAYGLPICLCAALLGACSSTSKEEAAAAANNPKTIYSNAQAEAGRGAFDKAIPFYDQLEGRAAGTPLAQQAQLDKAYAQYKDGQNANAIATLDRFMKLHPTSPGFDYALYLKGTINFSDNLGFLGNISNQDLAERDQQAARNSYDAYRELLERFPESRYIADARQRMNFIVNALAKYEVHVAKYYYSRGAYVAAINRAQLALVDYENAPALEDALHILINSYDALHMDKLRDDAKRVLAASFPNSTAPQSARDKSWWKIW